MFPVLHVESDRTPAVFVALALAALAANVSILSAQSCGAPWANGVAIAVNTALPQAPPNTTKIAIVDGTGKLLSTAALTAPAALIWTPTASDITTLTTAATAGGVAIAYVAATGATLCTQKFILAVSGLSVPPNNGASVSTGDCRGAGTSWDAQLAREAGSQSGHYTELVFLASAGTGDGNLCYYNRDYGVVGDPIYVGVFGDNTVLWTGVTFDPCAAQTAAPNILQSTDKFVSVTMSTTPATLQTFLPRRCYNTAVDVKVAGSAAGTAITKSFPLSQYDRYRATLQAGILFTTQHNSVFALRKDQADTLKQFIYDQGPTNRGPEYVATLQLYSILRYIPSIFGKPPYAGRDPIHDQSFSDRLGGIIGAGINNPGQRFVTGLSFEVIYGVSAIWVVDFARVTALEPDVSMTSPFLGTVAQIPTHSVWGSRSTFGMSIDLRYLSTLFTGNR